MLQSKAYILVINGIYTVSEAVVIAVSESNVPKNLRQHTAEQVWYKLVVQLAQ
jgi:hypothetical protein